MPDLLPNAAVETAPLPATAAGSEAARRRSEFLPFAPPAIGEEEIAEVVDTLRSPWLSTGPKTQRFEAEFAEFVDAPGALALSSCTAALHTARPGARAGLAGDRGCRPRAAR
jgi:hypothetical protein